MSIVICVIYWVMFFLGGVRFFTFSTSHFCMSQCGCLKPNPAQGRWWVGCGEGFKVLTYKVRIGAGPCCPVGHNGPGPCPPTTLVRTVKVQFSCSYGRRHTNEGLKGTFYIVSCEFSWNFMKVLREVILPVAQSEWTWVWKSFSSPFKWYIRLLSGFLNGKLLRKFDHDVVLQLWVWTTCTV